MNTFTVRTHWWRHVLSQVYILQFSPCFFDTWETTVCKTMYLYKNIWLKRYVYAVKEYRPTVPTTFIATSGKDKWKVVFKMRFWGLIDWEEKHRTYISRICNMQCGWWVDPRAQDVFKFRCQGKVQHFLDSVLSITIGLYFFLQFYTCN